jgi:TonB-dependent SusC/RagA subfamily outer membrane receptor
VLIAVAASHCGGGAPAAKRPAPEAAGGAPRSRTSTSDATVKRDEIHDQTFARIEELIQGRAPGVQVIRRLDGNFSLRIRGTSSPASSNEPLIVIDDVPVHELHVGEALAAINPRDVVRIEVLKDAASTAFYGMRGANGVIVVTTRRQ